MAQKPKLKKRGFGFQVINCQFSIFSKSEEPPYSIVLGATFYGPYLYLTFKMKVFVFIFFTQKGVLKPKDKNLFITFFG